MYVCIPFLFGGMTFHSQSMNRNKVKRDIGRHIFLKRFYLQRKAKRNLESDPSYHLLEKALKKSANDSLRDVFDVHTHKHTS